MKLGLLFIFLLAACSAETIQPMYEDHSRNANEQGKSGGWAQTGQLLTKDRNKGVVLAANFPRASYYTLQFGVTPPTPLIDGDEPIRFAILADITWSVAGNQVRRRVSVGNGSTISGPGEAISVRIYDNTDTADSQASRPYTVSVQVTPGTRPSTDQPPSLFANNYTAALLVSQSLAVDVPDNSGAISLEVAAYSSTAAVLNDLVIEQLDKSETTTYKIYRYADAPVRFVDLAPGCTRVKITRGTVAGGVAAVAFTFGIDG